MNVAEDIAVVIGDFVTYHMWSLCKRSLYLLGMYDSGSDMCVVFVSLLVAWQHLKLASNSTICLDMMTETEGTGVMTEVVVVEVATEEGVVVVAEEVMGALMQVLHVSMLGVCQPGQEAETWKICLQSMEGTRLLELAYIRYSVGCCE